MSELQERMRPHVRAALHAAGLVAERQVLYGHHVAGGRWLLPPAKLAMRYERDALPGSRNPWARQVILLAKRRNGAAQESKRPEYETYAGGT